MKSGRNAPCPCGSGKKHKACCGRTTSASSTPAETTDILVRATQLHDAGRLQDAVVLYQQILKTNPRHAVALHRLGMIAWHDRQHSLAVNLLQSAIHADASIAEAHFDLGKIFQTLSRPNEAISCYQRALSLKSPRRSEIHYNLGLAFEEQGNYLKAIESYERATKENPDLVYAHNNLGVLYKELGRYTESIRHYRHALDRDPSLGHAWNNLGNAYKEQGLLDEAIDCYGRAHKLAPEDIRFHDNFIFALNLTNKFSPERIYAEHVQFEHMHTHSLGLPETQKTVPDVTGRRIRVGYVSPDFCTNPVAYFIEPVLAHHDASKFEIFAYYNYPRNDAITQKLKTLCHHWRDTFDMSDEMLADGIRKDSIDILIDLAGHTAGNRLLTFARRPAPVQITWLGYPNTTGLSTIDYRITDSLADPPGMTETLHTEKLVRLPGIFCCYQPPSDSPDVRPPPASSSGCITFGSFNNFAKTTPAVIKLWSEILHATKESRLLLKCPGLSDESARQTVREQFATFGIEADRLTLLGLEPSRQAHLQRYHQIDIGLDPFPYNGTTTTCEALWMGIPVITLAGKTHASRVGVTLLNAINHPEWIADTQDCYVNIAKQLASDIGKLTTLRSGMRRQMLESPLLDAVSFTRNLESSFLDMIGRQALSP